MASITGDLLKTLGVPSRIELPGDTVIDVQAVPKAAEYVLGQTSQFILNTGLGLALVVAAWIATRWMAPYIHNALMRARTEETFAAFLTSITTYLLFGGAAVVGLRVAGADSTSLVTILGASALAIGFALRGTLTHVASGIMLMTNRPFRIGDWIQLDALEGRVKRITLFNTEVATLDNKRVFIPNTKLWEGLLINHTYSRERMVEVVMRGGFAVTPEEMKRVFLDALKTDDRVLPRPEPVVGIKQTVPEGVDYLVRAWVRTGDYAAMKLDLPVKLWAAMRREGLTIPAVGWASGLPEPAEKPAPKTKKKKA